MLYRGMAALIVGYFLGFPLLLPVLACLNVNQSPDSLPDWIFVLSIIGSPLWLAAAYWIYDTLFNLAESAWPAAKWIQEILSPIIKSLLLRHHSSR